MSSNQTHPTENMEISPSDQAAINATVSQMPAKLVDENGHTLSFHQRIAEKNEKLKKAEQWGYWFSGFARGPNAINGVFWSAAILKLASLDGTCESGSGTDGMQCTPDSWWNDTLWRNGLNGNGTGAACAETDAFGVPYYDMKQTPGCIQAYVDYRNATSMDATAEFFTPGRYTCK